MAAGLLVDGVASQHRSQGLRLSNSSIFCDMRFWAWVSVYLDLNSR